jgi:hypothetical protein
MQDSSGCDNNRTPVVFQTSDIFVFVGDINGFAGAATKSRNKGDVLRLFFIP